MKPGLIQMPINQHVKGSPHWPVFCYYIEAKIIKRKHLPLREILKIS